MRYQVVIPFDYSEDLTLEEVKEIIKKEAAGMALADFDYTVEQ
jgi:hypothetical protein|tara:strand:- start:988 stop:1116 length:129 start_codon:yes stop_codon:yes gene_type:complete